LTPWIDRAASVVLLAIVTWLFLAGHALGTDSSSLPSPAPALEPTGPPPVGSGAHGASSAQEEAEGRDRVMTESESDFIYRNWLLPHKSLIPPESVIALRNWYGIPAAVTLAVTGCETALGDPKLGGRLVPEAFNFGCVKAGSPNTPWGELACGTISVGGQRWWKWPTSWTGMAALGRLLKVGPGKKPGYYLDCIHREDWRAFTAMYYGASVPGYSTYHKRWVRLYNVFKNKLHDAGF